MTELTYHQFPVFIFISNVGEVGSKGLTDLGSFTEGTAVLNVENIKEGSSGMIWNLTNKNIV